MINKELATTSSNKYDKKSFNYEELKSAMDTIDKAKDRFLINSIAGLRVIVDKELDPEEWYISYKNEFMG